MKKSIKLECELIYDELTDKFSEFQIPHPLSICYKISKYCNFSCSHCITSGGIKEDYGLETSKAKKIIKNISDSGIKRLDITGGEPFLRNDISDIIEYANSLGLEVVITSNGSCFTKEHLELLSKLQIFTQISIDGPKDINDKLRMEGSYDIAIKAIKKLQDYNIPLRINCTLQNENKHVIPEMVKIAEDNNIKNLYFILVCAQGKAYENKEQYCLIEKDEAILRKEILKYRNDKKVNVKMLDFKKYSHACTLIDYNGDFISQTYLEKDCINVGNILKEDLNILWKKKGAFDHALHLMQYMRHPMLYK